MTTRTTGCLGSDGNFSGFALGDAPLAGCPAGQNQVALKLDDLSDGAATAPFFVTLRFGEEQIIAQNGALELRALHFGSGSGDSLQLVVRSTLDGWLATSAGRSTTTENLAGDEVVLFTAAGRPDQGRLSGFGDERLTGAQMALAPDGSFLALALGSTALGVGLFNQDCLAVGTASLIRGALPGPPTLGQPLQGLPDTSGGVATGNPIVGAVGGNGISVGVTIGNPISGSPATGMSPIDGGIVPPLGGGISLSAAALRCRTAAFRRWAAASHRSAAPRRCPTAAFRPWAAASRRSAVPRRCPTAAFRHSAVASRRSAVPRRCPTAAFRHWAVAFHRSEGDGRGLALADRPELGYG